MFFLQICSSIPTVLVRYFFHLETASLKTFRLIYRQDCRVAANCRYCFYSQAKNQVFRPTGATRCTDSGQTLQDRLAPGSALLCKISRQSVQTGGNAAPKYQKLHFLVKSRTVGATPLNDFENF